MNITLKQAREMRELLLSASSEDLKNGWKSILNKDILTEEVLSENNKNNASNEDIEVECE